MYEIIAGDGPLVLSSPWPIPLMLAPSAPKDPRKDMISYTSFKDETWAPVTKFYGEHATNARPSFATYRSEVFLFHRGGEGNQQIFYMKYQPKFGWDLDKKDKQVIPGVTSAFDVAACEYGGQLDVVHHGNGKDASLWHVRRTGENWSSDQKIPYMYTASGPALAVFKGRLYMVARGTENNLWYTSWNGSTWSTYVKMNYVYSSAGPALAEYRGYLYCVARGMEGSLWWTRFDGHTWSRYVQISSGHAFTSGAPALCHYSDRLLCAARGNEGNLWFTMYDGSDWSAYYDTHISVGGNGVGLTEYQSDLSDKNKGKEVICAFESA